jgi:hypothetical protein
MDAGEEACDLREAAQRRQQARAIHARALIGAILFTAAAVLIRNFKI